VIKGMRHHLLVELLPLLDSRKFSINEEEGNFEEG